MIKLEIKPFGCDVHTHEGDHIKYVYINEKTMTVDHYDEGVTSEQLDHFITLIQKIINSICGMEFARYEYRYRTIQGGTYI